MSRTRVLTAIPLILILVGVIYFSADAPIFFFLVGNLFVGLGLREFTRMAGGIRSMGMGMGVALRLSISVSLRCRVYLAAPDTLVNMNGTLPEVP